MSEYECGYKDAVADTMKKCVVSNEAERNVIEAAERYRIELAGGYDGEAAGAHKKLLLAVEALAELKEKR